MKTTIQLTSAVLAAMLMLAGCGGGGSSGSVGATTPTGPGTPAAGAFDPGGAGVATDQVTTASGAVVTANFTSALAINDRNQVIGYAEVIPGALFTASLWTVNADGGSAVAPTALAPISAGGFAAAFAIDGRSNVVGQAADGGRLVAVIWNNGAGAPAILPQLAAAGHYAAYGISTDGSLIVGEAADATGNNRAVLWMADAAGAFGAPTLLPANIFASGIDLSQFSSASGVARVGAAEILVAGEAEAGNGNLHGALWRSVDGGASFSAVDLGVDQIAYAVNGSRQVVGENLATLKPVSWTVSDAGVASAPVALAAAGSAVAINERGRIAGTSGSPGLATVWSETTPTTQYTTASQAFGLNNELQPLVVGQVGNLGFVKRAN